MGGLHILVADGVTLDLQLLHAVGPVIRLSQLAFEGTHGQSGFFGQAHIDTATAAGAVIGRDLETVGILAAHALGIHGIEARGLGRFLGAAQQDGPDGSMGADQSTLVALEALGGVPLRDLHGSAALFKLGGTGRPSAVFHSVLHHGGNGDAVALLMVHHRHHILNESGSRALLGGILCIQPAVRDGDFLELIDAVVDGGVVHVHHGLPLLLVIGLVNGLLHLRDRLRNGDNAGEGEERSLQNGVGAAAKPQFPGDTDSVDGV